MNAWDKDMDIGGVEDNEVEVRTAGAVGFASTDDPCF